MDRHVGNRCLSGLGQRPGRRLDRGRRDRTGEAYHYDGTCIEVAVPEGVGLLVPAQRVSPPTTWAVGVDGAGVHWDGEWSAVNFGTTEDLWGVFGFSTDDIWTVGGDPNEGDLIIGTTPAPCRWFRWHPAEPRGAKSLFKVWGIEGELYITGQTAPCCTGTA